MSAVFASFTMSLNSNTPAYCIYPELLGSHLTISMIKLLVSWLYHICLKDDRQVSGLNNSEQKLQQHQRPSWRS